MKRYGELVGCLTMVALIAGCEVSRGVVVDVERPSMEAEHVAAVEVSPAAEHRAAEAGVPVGLVLVLDEALDDERRAIRTYELVMARFGERRPYSNIIRAERRHAAALLAHYERLGIGVPADRWAEAEIEIPRTFGEAAARSAQAEIDNAAMYERLLRDASLEGRAEIARTLRALRDASAKRHLPAFRRHAGG